jgi:hypothetical protein
MSSQEIEKVVAMTIDEIEEASSNTDERTELRMDLKVGGDMRVYYADGSPFRGFLSRKNTLLLRRIGKIFIPTVGRATHKVVNMPEIL